MQPRKQSHFLQLKSATPLARSHCIYSGTSQMEAVSQEQKILSLGQPQQSPQSQHLQLSRKGKPPVETGWGLTHNEENNFGLNDISSIFVWHTKCQRTCSIEFELSNKESNFKDCSIFSLARVWWWPFEFWKTADPQTDCHKRKERASGYRWSNCWRRSNLNKIEVWLTIWKVLCFLQDCFGGRPSCVG